MDFKLLFDKAKKKNVEAIQVHLEEVQEIDFHIFNGELDKHQLADTRRLSLKGIYDGKMGKMTTEDINDDNMDEWIAALIDSAKAVESTDPVFIYEGDTDYRDIPELSQSHLDTLSHDEKLQMTFDLEKKVKELDDRIKISQAFYGEATKKVTLKNSKGLDLSKNVTNALLGADCVAREDDDSRSSFEFVQSNDPADFDLNKIARDLVDRAVSQLGAKSLKSGRYDILLENRASATLLQGFVGMFKAEAVQKGMSKLKDKLDQTIASSNITLVDDPFKLKSTKSGSFDDEGVATKYKEIIKEGKLTTYLYDLKTAKKDNVTSTGNAFAGGIAPTNLYIQKGNESFDALLSELDNGLVITSLQGVHSGTNPISGDFSLQATGYLIKDGEIERPIALFTISGNYLDMLKQVDSVGEDLKFTFAYIGSPTLRINNVIVSGE